MTKAWYINVHTQVWFFYFQYTLIANSTWVSPHCLNLSTVNSNIRNSINFVFLFSFSFGFLICLHLNSYKLSQCTALLLGFPFPIVPRTPCTSYLDPLGYHSAGSHFAVAFYNVCKIPFLRLEMFVLLPPHPTPSPFWSFLNPSYCDGVSHLAEYSWKQFLSEI